jgi:transcriptional regulator with XRE-family HTH domain
MIRQQIAMELRKIREGQGIGLKEYADQLGIPAGNLCWIEKGYRPASIHTLDKIARGLGYEVKVKLRKRGV